MSCFSIREEENGGTVKKNTVENYGPTKSIDMSFLLIAKKVNNLAFSQMAP